MSQMLFDGVWRHARIKHDAPLAIELTVRGLVFLPLFIRGGGRKIMQGEKGGKCAAECICPLLIVARARAAVSLLYPAMLDFMQKRRAFIMNW